MKRKPRLKIGDVVEVKTPAGLGYVHYTHFNREYRQLVRMLPGLYERQPDLAELVQCQELGVVFVFLQESVNDGDISRVVGNCPVPARCAAFPLFRTDGGSLRNGKAPRWWFWDGERDWLIGQITREQRRMPLAEVLSETALVNRLVEQWTPESDTR